MRDIGEVLRVLEGSEFRRSKRLGPKDAAYLHAKGIETVIGHARNFVEERLAPANPKNDGKQTPWRGHPVFVAQHATATCCRGCLAKWHRIPKGSPLSVDEISYVVDVLRSWLEKQVS
jgi:hypothetical protein